MICHTIYQTVDLLLPIFFLLEDTCQINHPSFRYGDTILLPQTKRLSFGWVCLFVFLVGLFAVECKQAIVIKKKEHKR